MKNKSNSNARLAAILLVFLASLFASATSQDTPTPLSDGEFASVLESDDTTQWLKIHAMTDDQAKQFLKRRGVNLALGFSGDDVNSLYLNGLTKLTPQQAKQLAKHKAALCLDGLTELPLEVAKGLLGYQGQYISRRLYAETLNKGRGSMNLGGIVTLNGLDSLSDELSNLLCRLRAFELQLNGVQRLSDTQAKGLGKSESFLLQLSSVTSLSDNQAKSLAMYKSLIFLPKLDQESRERFKKYGGELIDR